MTHTIKLNENFCQAVLDGEKTFEIRENDRGYQTGDYINFEPVYGSPYRNHSFDVLKNKTYKITYVLNGWGIKNGFVVFSFCEVDK